MFNNMDGIYVYPKLDILPVIKLLKKYISGLGNNIYIAICIFKNDDLYFSLIIGKKDGKINFISTLDHLEHVGIKNITPKDKEKVLNALKDAFKENVVLKFMKFDELEELVKNIV
ncbi:hypothetical protein [Thermoanaerobacterium thermosulfurigenes]|uniref:hypothetical protein n=1 Tax=Thermoanaerobacterium thermosulfurigenes TaxID=33950 RepID=UPI003F4A77A7